MRNHGDLVGNFKNFFEFLGQQHNCHAIGGQIEQALAQKRRCAHIHTPSGLRNNHEFGRE